MNLPRDVAHWSGRWLDDFRERWAHMEIDGKMDSREARIAAEAEVRRRAAKEGQQQLGDIA